MYGLLDYPNATSGTKTRPEQLAPVTTLGAWTTQNNMIGDLAAMQNVHLGKGFYGPYAIVAPPVLKPYLTFVLSSTVTIYKTFINSLLGYPIYFSDHFDSDATKDACDIYMIDTSKFKLFMTPLKNKAFYSNDQDDYVWRWQTRAAYGSLPKYDGTEWLKGIVKCALDIDGT